MNHLQKLQKTSILKWVSSNFAYHHKTSSLFCIARRNPRPYCTKGMDSVDNSRGISHVPRAARLEAQSVLSEYLHSTRNLQFTDAESMSKNSPYFLEKLLERVDPEEHKEDIGRAIARFLRYHPINEYEPFFESLGLEPGEYNSYLPRDLMFLSDDTLLLENYHVLCNHGIVKNKIGKIYREATDVFHYSYGVLESKLKAYEELGISQTFIAKVVVCSPYLLIGDVDSDFTKVLEILRKGGIGPSWIEKHLLEKTSYNWSRLLVLLNTFTKSGYNEEKLCGAISQNPGILFEFAEDGTLPLIGFLFKFGLTMNQICSMFLQFPQMKVGQFVLNLRHCLRFLNEIEMEVDEIGKIVRSYPLMLGSCRLKKTVSLLGCLNVGKKRLCKIIEENPHEMKKWVMGSKVEPLPNSGEDLRSQLLKTKFLLDLGFVENSKEMNKALKVFRGKGTEMQERFDCIVKAGLDRKDVCLMVKVSPQVLNQTKDHLQRKIDFLINDLGYDISTLITFPSYLSYTIQRVKLRFEMYNWLKDQGAAEPILALSTIVACSDKVFIRQYVKHHPRGPEIWEDLKKKVYSE